MTWTYEALADEEWRIVETKGIQSRTVFLAYRWEDVKFLLEILENHELMTHGIPVEMPLPSPRKGKREANPGTQGRTPGRRKTKA